MEGGILVLGATGGIGEVLCERLAKRGARLTLCARGADRLEALAARLGGAAHALDARDPAAVEAAVERAAEGGRLVGAVNLVGSLLLKPAHRTRPEEWDEVMATNLGTAFHLVRAAAPALRKGGGSIVLVSSAAAGTGMANHEAVAAAKAGVEGLARSAAASYAASGVRVNCVAPGLVRTPLSERITRTASGLAASEAMHPLGRIGEPADVAAAIEWLLAPGSEWITGQVLGVDGGLATLRPPRSTAGRRAPESA